MIPDYVVGTILGSCFGLLGTALMARHQVVMAREKLRLEKIEQIHKVLSLVARHAAILRDRYLALGRGEPPPGGGGFDAVWRASADELTMLVQLYVPELESRAKQIQGILAAVYLTVENFPTLSDSARLQLAGVVKSQVQEVEATVLASRNEILDLAASLQTAPSVLRRRLSHLSRARRL